MRNGIVKPLARIALTLLVTASLASAQGSVVLNVDADSLGWRADGAYFGGPYALCASIVLTADAPWPAGTLIEQSETELSLPGATEATSFLFQDSWLTEPGPGTYYATMVAVQVFGTTCDAGIPVGAIVAESLPFIVEAAATSPTAEPRGQGYWRNHPEAWPVTSLVLGGRALDQDELMGVLKRPTKGDATVSLARQLIAAKLNVANGVDPATLATTGVLADDYLVRTPLLSRPKGAAKAEAESLKNLLEDFNSGASAQ